MPSFHSPGPQIQEPSGRTPPIAAASTGVTAFLGIGGRAHPAQLVSSLAEFDGGLGRTAAEPLSRAVRGFFANGGTQAWVASTPRATAKDIRAAWADLHPDVSLAALAAKRPPGPELLTVAADVVSAHDGLLIVEGPWPDAAAAIAAMRGGSESALGVAGPDAAVYWPPVDGASLAGAVAGLIARTPIAQPPAGTHGELRELGPPPIQLPPDAVKELSGLGVNIIRRLEGTTLAWGARTLSTDPEWKYVPVRRTAVHLERSIDAALGWVVFEPNDEPLWRRVRAVVSDFLLGLFRDGVLRGTKPGEAFFVQCDRTTMTQNDLDNGRLIIVIGFAPIKPAEFVILRVEHKTAGAR